MKKIFISTFIVFIGLLTNAQIPPVKLTGTWTLIKYDYGNGNTGDQTRSGFRKMMIVTPEYFTVLDYDTSRVVIKTALYGSYRPNYFCCIGPYPNKVPGKSIVEEYVLAATGTLSQTVKRKFYYRLELDKEGFLHIQGENDNVKTSEVWMPVKESFSKWADAKSKKPFDIEESMNFDARVLLVLKNGNNEVILKRNKLYPKPFSFLPQIEIESVELLCNEEAIQRYGLNGRFGVLILTPLEKYLQTTIAQLKKQKNM